MRVKSRMGIQAFEVFFFRRSLFFSECKENILIVFENTSANIMWFVFFLGIFTSELDTILCALKVVWVYSRLKSFFSEKSFFFGVYRKYPDSV